LGRIVGKGRRKRRRREKDRVKRDGKARGGRGNAVASEEGCWVRGEGVAGWGMEGCTDRHG